MSRFLERMVELGRYQTTDEAVREGLRLLQDRESFRAYVTHAIEVAESDVKAGRLMTPATAIRRLKNSRRPLGHSGTA